MATDPNQDKSNNRNNRNNHNDLNNQKNLYTDEPEICRRFQKGKCKKGQFCKFYHPTMEPQQQQQQQQQQHQHYHLNERVEDLRNFQNAVIYNAEHENEYVPEQKQDLNLSTTYHKSQKEKKRRKKKRKKKTAKQLITIQISSIPLAKTIDDAILHGASTSYSFSYNTNQSQDNVIQTIKNEIGILANRLLLGEINIINFESDDDENDEREDDENEQSTSRNISEEPTARNGW